MMRSLLSGLLLFSLAILAAAQEEDKPASIMLQKPAGVPAENLVGGTSESGERCRSMSQEIEQLKGNPLQRSALLKRYEVECKDRQPTYP